MDYSSLIRINPGRRFGKPCVRDIRISVHDVLGWLAADISVEEIIRDFPELTKMDILACLAFAADREQNRLSAS